MADMAALTARRELLAAKITKLRSELSALEKEHDDLVTAERVMAAFGAPRGRRAKRTVALPAKPAVPRAAKNQTRRGHRPASAWTVGTPAIADLVLDAVRARPEGISSTDLKQMLSARGHEVRMNHLGRSLAAHQRRGTIEKRGDLWTSSEEGLTAPG